MAVTAEQVLKAMQDAGKPVRPGDVAKALDADSKEVSKAIDELKKSGKIMSPKRCYYAPAAFFHKNFSPADFSKNARWFPFRPHFPR